MSDADRNVRLAAVPGFPRGSGLNWTLGKLLDRVQMVAQFHPGRWTFAEALFQAFMGIEFTAEIWAGWDDEMREYATECNCFATAARDAVVGYLKVKP